MPDEQHYRRLENMYHGAPTNVYFEPRLSVSRGEAQVTILVRKDFFHTGGAVHGAVYFKAMDDAAFFAASSLVDEVLLVTVSFHLHLLRPISQGRMTARGSVVQYTPRLIIAESSLLDDRGREIARGAGDFVPTQKALNAEVGYA